MPSPVKPGPRPSIMAAVGLGVAAALLTGCSQAEPAAHGAHLTGLLLPGDAVPPGYTVVPTAVEDLVTANRATLDDAKSVAFDPKGCAPTADAAFNPKLTPDNTVLLVAQSETGTFSELLSTEIRDLNADRRDTSGACAVVTATPSRGTFAGVPIVNTTTVLRPEKGDKVVDSYLVRTDSVKALPTGAARSRTALLAAVLVKRLDGSQVTLQLGISGNEVEISRESVQAAELAGTRLTRAPLREAQFRELVQAAIVRAAGE